MSATFRIGPAVVLVAPSISSPLADWTEVHRTQGGVNVTLPSPAIARGKVNTAAAPVAAWMAPGMSMVAFKMVNRDLATMAAMLPTAVQMTSSAKKALKLNASLSEITPVAIAVVPVSEYNDDLMFLGSPSAVWYEKAVVKVGEMQAMPVEDSDDLDGYQVEIMSMSGYSGIGYPEIADTGLDIQGLGLFYQPQYDTLDPIQGPAATFTRASTATYVDDDGVIQTATSNTIRIQNGRGLLEPQRTNLHTYSEQFDNAAWNKTASTISANATTAPDGNTTADKFVEDSATTTHRMQQVVTVVSGVAHVISVFAKAGERSWILLMDNDTGRGRYFNLSTGALGGVTSTPDASGADDMGDGWYRCWIRVITASTQLTTRIYLSTSDGGITYAGNGSSGLYLWGAVVEAGSYATSYIPTVASTVTRNADAFQITWADRPSVQEDWTAMVKMRYLSMGSTGSTQFRVVSSDSPGIEVFGNAVASPHRVFAYGFTLDSNEGLESGTVLVDEETEHHLKSDADGNLSYMTTEGGTDNAADTFAWSAVKNSTDEFGDAVVFKYYSVDVLAIDAIVIVRGLLTPTQMRRILR